jgi:O-antigen ligase
MRLPGLRARANKLSIYGLLGLGVLIISHLLFQVGDLLVGLLGRDMTLTGRTEIWGRLINADVNPIIGVGYYSFWLGDRVEKMSQGFYYHLNEAHNGYLETYLNSGFIGLALLVIVLGTSFRKLQGQLQQNPNFAALRLAFLSCVLIYGFTEAVFDRLNLLWLVLLLSVTEGPRAPRPAAQVTRRSEESVSASPEVLLSASR